MVDDTGLVITDEHGAIWRKGDAHGAATRSAVALEPPGDKVCHTPYHSAAVDGDTHNLQSYWRAHVL